LTRVLGYLGLHPSAWYGRRAAPVGHRRPGPKPRPVREPLRRAILAAAKAFPWWGYQRIAVVCRRQEVRVSNKQAYRVMRDHDLLRKPLPRAAELYQTAKLFELLPQRPNDLWQADVTTSTFRGTAGGMRSRSSTTIRATCWRCI
jgi:hypothetical protein